MKARIPCTSKERKFIEKSAISTAVRLNKILIIAIYDVFGIGAKRIYKLLRHYNSLVQEYQEYSVDGVADEMVDRKLKEIKVDFNKVYEGEANEQ